MNIKITKEDPDYSKMEWKNKKMVVVQFPNCISTTTNKPFKWMPTYLQLYDIRKALSEIEVETWKH